MGEMARRFSDQELADMHDELKSLSRRFEEHKEEVHTDLEELNTRFDKHKTEAAKKFDAMINAVNQNTTSIDKLTDETQEIVELHRDLQGTARVGKSVQNALLWLVKWGAIGTALAAVIEWVLIFMKS
jgi:ferritin-like metal-binding protein YciE